MKTAGWLVLFGRLLVNHFWAEPMTIWLQTAAKCWKKYSKPRLAMSSNLKWYEQVSSENQGWRQLKPTSRTIIWHPSSVPKKFSTMSLHSLFPGKSLHWSCNAQMEEWVIRIHESLQDITVRICQRIWVERHRPIRTCMAMPKAESFVTVACSSWTRLMMLMHSHWLFWQCEKAYSICQFPKAIRS